MFSLHLSFSDKRVVLFIFQQQEETLGDAGARMETGLRPCSGLALLSHSGFISLFLRFSVTVLLGFKT